MYSLPLSPFRPQMLVVHIDTPNVAWCFHSCCLANSTYSRQCPSYSATLVGLRARAVLVELRAAGRGCLRVRPRSAPVAPGLDGADEGLVPPGDLGGALVADLARLDAHRGVRKASPAAPTWRRRPLRRGARAHRPRCRSRRRGCRSTSPRRSRRAPRCSPRARERAAAPRCAPAGGPSACARPPTRGPTAGPTAPTRRSSAAPRSPAAATAPPPGSTYAPQGLVDAPRPTAREAVVTTTRTSPES